jgi:hypothetical protein
MTEQPCPVLGQFVQILDKLQEPHEVNALNIPCSKACKPSDGHATKKMP